MNKRILATILWFFAGWTAGAMASFFVGLPDGLNVVLAVAVGGFVWFDPAGVLWPQSRRVLKKVPEPEGAAGKLATE